MQHYAIIVAGGKGSRMKSEVPKQFLEIDNKPILVHTIEKFIAFDPSIKLIIVLPANHLGDWDRIRQDHFPNRLFETVIGGATRTDSVKSGLAKIREDGWVAIHDAARPFVGPDIIEQSFESAKTHGSGVTAVSLKDSIRERLSDDTSVAREREHYVLVQTPQTFRVSTLKEAYEKAGDHSFSDDATVYEKAGHNVHLVEGDYANLKITTKEDLGRY